MPAHLHSIATAVPAHAYDQEHALEVMKAWHGGDRRTSRLLSGIYRASEIERRHSVVGDFQPDSGGGFFYLPDEDRFRDPSTGERNAAYAREAGSLASCAARRTVSASDMAPHGITHLITFSCTGFYAPGLDLDVVRELGLPDSVERYHLGFMGCYAAFPAMRLARSICMADENAVVLIVSVELCTLHLQAGKETDELLAASVFADGAAAALVTARPPKDRSSFQLEAFHSALATDARDAMAWTIGDSGFTMTLSSEVPRVVQREVGYALAPLWERAGVTREDMAGWAVHPGGRAILDSFASALQLPDGSLNESREVLRGYGNMSSATVLFVLDHMLRREAPSGPVTAVAFGPGLAVESALLRPVA